MLIQTIKRFIVEEDGGLGSFIGYFFGSICVFLLVLSLYEYNYQLANADQIKTAMNSAVLSSVTDNYDELYAGFRNGQAVSATFNEYSQSYEIKFDEGDVMDYLVGELQLVKEGTHYRRGVQYELYDLEILQVSKPINNPNASTITFYIDLKITYEAPSYFLFRGSPYIKEVKTRAKYISKF